jgi:hypothetical protein
LIDALFLIDYPGFSYQDLQHTPEPIIQILREFARQSRKNA